MTLDRATSSLPKLLHRRLDEMGLDFTIIYPSMGMFMLHFPGDELRRAMCCAYNELHAEIFREYRDRMTAVAIIPMHTPTEVIDELPPIPCQDSSWVGVGRLRFCRRRRRYPNCRR